MSLLGKNYADHEWMNRQIASDLEYYRKNPYSQLEFESYFQSHGADKKFVKFTLNQGQIFYACSGLDNEIFIGRFDHVHSTLIDLASKYNLPDCTFYVSLHDGNMGTGKVDTQIFPVWLFAKKLNNEGVLMPDFFVLSNNYRDMFPLNFDPQKKNWPVSFQNKNARLVFRGTNCYHGGVTKENYHDNMRLKLVELSNQHPDLIDAGIAFAAQTEEECLSRVESLIKPRLSCSQIINHKYQMWIDGNVTSYSSSGWRFYTGSCVLKSDSEWIQWYFGAIHSGKHYIAIREDLSDLVDKLFYLQEHQDHAEQIASNGLQFVRDNINYDACLLYLHKLIWAYSELPTRD